VAVGLAACTLAVGVALGAGVSVKDDVRVAVAVGSGVSVGVLLGVSVGMAAWVSAMAVSARDCAVAAMSSGLGPQAASRRDEIKKTKLNLRKGDSVLVSLL
jgi:hypothetical protein